LERRKEILMETKSHKSTLDFILLKGHILALIYELNQSESLLNEYEEYIEKFDKMWKSKGEKNDYSKGHSIWNNHVIVDRNKKIKHVLWDPFFFSIEAFLMKEGIRKVVEIKEKDLVKLLYTPNISHKKYFAFLRILFGEHWKRDYDALMEEKKSLNSIKEPEDKEAIQENVEENVEEQIEEKEGLQNTSKDESIIKKEEDLMKNLKEADMRIKKDLEEVSSTINSVLKESWEKEEVIQQLNMEIQDFKEENTNLKNEIEDLRKIKGDFSKLKELLLKMDREHGES